MRGYSTAPVHAVFLRFLAAWSSLCSVSIGKIMRPAECSRPVTEMKFADLP